ncbi:hypothetical protein D3C79_646850 [compost metagenome]
MGKCHVDQPTGIDHVVGRIQYPARLQLVGYLQGGQLVVRRPRHCRATQLHHALPVQHRPHAARGKDVARGADQRIVGHRMGIELLHRQPHPPRVQIAHQQVSTRRMQLLRQRITDIAQPLHRNPQPLQVITAKAERSGGTNAGKNPHRRMR